MLKQSSLPLVIAMLLVAAAVPAAASGAASDCPSGNACLFADAGYAGDVVRWSPGGTGSCLRMPPWDVNLTSSWINNSGRRISVDDFRFQSFDWTWVTLWTMAPHTGSSWVGAFANDRDDRMCVVG